ncbi:MAG TPA: hypothetical protein VMH03_19775 [Terriglobales bacterium]|nr:hypothetical protein [Terriglobales bacterium]
MDWRFSPTAVFGLFLLLFATGSRHTSAQVEVFVTPIPNAPFSGVVRVERSFVQPEGSVANLKSMHDIGRDSRGRIHNEARAMVPVSSVETPRVISIHLYDPQTRISTTLDPKERTFRTRTLNHPPATVPPSVRYGSPSDNGLPQNEFTKAEDLGVNDMQGLPVHGVREVQTIPGENGENKEIVITDECWYSEDLRINMMIKHNDPRKGTVRLSVTQVTRTEPDPALFEIPEGYKPVTAAGETNH